MGLTLLTFILPLILCSLFEQGLCDDEDVKYVAWFSDDVKGCKNFENDMMVVDLKMEPTDEYMIMCLNGTMEAKKEIPDGTMLKLEISKIKSSNEQLVTVMESDLCASLKDEDAPWSEMMKKLGITKCPIPAKLYNVFAFRLDINCEHFCESNVGTYVLKLSLLDQLQNVISCHLLGMDVGRSEE